MIKKHDNWKIRAFRRQWCIVILPWKLQYPRSNRRAYHEYTVYCNLLKNQFQVIFKMC